MSGTELIKLKTNVVEFVHRRSRGDLSLQSLVVSIDHELSASGINNMDLNDIFNVALGAQIITSGEFSELFCKAACITLSFEAMQ